jgi:hypothetical protein
LVNTILQILMKTRTVSRTDRKLRNEGTGETLMTRRPGVGWEMRIEFRGEVKSVEYFLKSSS